MAISRKIKCLNENSQKVVSFKIFTDLKLDLSVKTVQIHVQQYDYAYKKSKSPIILSDHHKAERTKKLVTGHQETIISLNPFSSMKSSLR